MFKNIYWADLHNHNEIGYGAGSLGRSYEIAKGAGLHIYAFTPHGHWHDVPQNDAALAAYHKKGFDEKVVPNWKKVKEKAEAEYKPGAFVTFPAFEWHSSRSGDYHALFPFADFELPVPKSIDELKAFVRGRKGIMIPHHCAYKRGWRGTDWSCFDPDVSPVVDVFSEHGNGMEGVSHLSYALHSMGGAEKSQTVMEQLKKGLKAGLVASTDNHVGHPASYGEGLAAIIAGTLDRQGVLEALRKRRTYAATGDRILIDFSLNNAAMGDTLSAPGPRTVRFTAEGLCPFESVQIIKNGLPAASWCAATPGPARRDDRFTMRVEFGWDAMTSKETTVWRIRLKLEQGRVLDVVPCFCGGGSAEKTNRVAGATETETGIEAYTARQNSRPTSSVVLKVAGSPATRVRAEVEAEYRGKTCRTGLESSLGELRQTEAWAAVSDVFSAPRIRLGEVFGESENTIRAEWQDPKPGPADFYLVRALQKNGHMAWTSPIWCAQ